MFSGTTKVKLSYVKGPRASNARSDFTDSMSNYTCQKKFMKS